MQISKFFLLPALLLFSFSSAVTAQTAASRDFFQNATEAGMSNRWQAITWQPSMDRAKALASQQNKAILVVLHNNFGGDNSSHDC